MTELIKVSENKTISAKELYEYLGYDKGNWAIWAKKNIVNNEYASIDEDWVGFLVTRNGNQTNDFALSISFAKKLAMMARTEKGEQARKYFIECEKQLQKPISIEEMIIAQAQSVLQAKKQLEALESRVATIEAKNISSTMDYYTIAGYWSLNNKTIDIKGAAKLGKQASTLCNQLGFVMGQIPDPRFGRVKTYPIDVLKSVYEKNL